MSARIERNIVWNQELTTSEKAKKTYTANLPQVVKTGITLLTKDHFYLMHQ